MTLTRRKTTFQSDIASHGEKFTSPSQHIKSSQLLLSPSKVLERLCPFCFADVVKSNWVEDYNEHLRTVHTILSVEMCQSLAMNYPLKRFEGKMESVEAKIVTNSNKKFGHSVDLEKPTKTHPPIVLRIKRSATSSDKENAFHCDHCDRKFYSQTALSVHKFHLKKRNSLTDISAISQDNATSAAATLANVVLNEPTILPFACTICQRTFPTSAALSRHKFWSNKGKGDCIRKSTEPIMPPSPVYDVKPHLMSPKTVVESSNDQSLACDHCDRVFPTSLGLSIHKTWIIRRSSLVSNDVAAASASSDEEAPVKSELVNAKSLDNSSSNIDKENGVKCEHCDRVFPTPMGLTVHKSHVRRSSALINQDNLENDSPEQSSAANGVNGVKCDHCDRIFTTQMGLSLHKSHIRRTSVVSNEESTENNTSEESSTESQTDNSDSTEEKTHPCDHCDRVFPSQHGLSIHKFYVKKRASILSNEESPESTESETSNEETEDDEDEEEESSKEPEVKNAKTKSRNSNGSAKENSLMCDHCNRVFPTQMGLSIHKTWVSKRASAVSNEPVSSSDSSEDEPLPVQNTSNRSSHNSSNEIRCFHCAQVFATQSDQLQHLRSILQHGHITPDQLAFNRLAESAVTSYRYDTTSWTSQEVEALLSPDFHPFTCPICKVPWPSARLYEQHQQVQHPNNCGNKFIAPSQLQSTDVKPPSSSPAKSTMNEKELQPVHKISRSIATKLQLAASISPWAAPVEEFFCRYCCMRFHSRTHLESHESSCLLLPRECSKCGLRFAANYAMLAHEKYCAPSVTNMTDHSTGEDTVACVLNGEDLDSELGEMGVQNEKAVRQSGPPYICLGCKKSFVKYCGFKSHKNSCQEKKEEAVECEYCGTTFARRCHLTNHLKGCHKIKFNGNLVRSESERKVTDDYGEQSKSKFKKESGNVCCKCDRRFKFLEELQLHSRSECPKNMHVCSHCGAKFTSRNNLLYHQHWACDKPPELISDTISEIAAPPQRHSSVNESQKLRLQNNNNLAQELRRQNSAHQASETRRQASFNLPTEFRRFTSNTNVSLDSRRHSQEPVRIPFANATKFGCAVCGLLFSSEQRLARHKELTHLNYVPVAKRFRMDLVKMVPV